MSTRFTPGEWKAEILDVGAVLVQPGRGEVVFGYKADGTPDIDDCQLAADAPAMLDLLHSIALYFKSGNSVPVSRATLSADSAEVRQLFALLSKHGVEV